MRGAYLPYRQRLGQVRLLAKKAKDENKGKTHTGIVKTTIAAMSPHLVASGSSNHIMFLSYPPPVTHPVNFASEDCRTGPKAVDFQIFRRICILFWWLCSCLDGYVGRRQPDHD